MRRTQRAAVTGGLGLAYLVLLVSAVVPLPILFFIAAVAAVVTELLLSRRAPHLLPEALNTRAVFSGGLFTAEAEGLLEAIVTAMTPDRLRANGLLPA